MKKMPSYKILTETSVLDIESDDNEELKRDSLYNKQMSILNSFNIGYFDTCGIHTFESAYTYHSYDSMSVADAIENLAIKDGADIVQFENGNIGFVAYYNGIKNGFEIIELI